MKFFLSALLISSLAFAQAGLTQKDKEFANHVKQVWSKVTKDNYKKLFTDLTNDCNDYLKANPNTAIKPGIFGYVFEMKAVMSNNPVEITKAAEKLLMYDKSIKTNIRVAQVLIEKKVNDKMGVGVLQKILPSIKPGQQYYDAHLLLAAGEMHMGNYSGAMNSLNEAIKSDSSRIDAYRGLRDVMKTSGQTKGLAGVEAKINELDKDPNINVDISSLSLDDINGNRVNFSDFRGSVVAMIFFRFECPYCRKDMPVLKNLIKKYPAVKFVFINLNESLSDIKTKFLPENQFSFLQNQTIITFADIFDKMLDITITPQTLIVDKNSIVKFDYRGYQENFEGKFEADIKTLR